jgi:putative N6-adenine-specific DNA methylase
MLIADPDVEQTVREELLAGVDFGRTIRIYGSDADEQALVFAKANLRRAYDLARGKVVSLERSRSRRHEESAPDLSLPGDPALPDLRTSTLEDAGKGWPPRGNQGGGPRQRGAADGRRQHKEERADEPEGFIITNPPYGIRLGDPGAAEAVYRNMAEVSRKFPGWKLGIITDHPGFESHFGKKADSCKEITNGAIHSYFYQYEKL